MGEVESSRSRPRDVVLLGSTGSVGTQAADVIRRNPDRFRVTGLAAGGGNPDLLAAQAIEFGVAVVAVAQESAVSGVREALKAHAARAGGARAGPPPTALTGQPPGPPARPIPPPLRGHGLSDAGGAGRAPLPTVLAGTDAIAEVGPGTARVWRLYMAGSRLGFDRNVVELHQILGVRLEADGESHMPLRPDWESAPAPVAAG